MLLTQDGGPKSLPTLIECRGSVCSAFQTLKFHTCRVKSLPKASYHHRCTQGRAQKTEKSSFAAGGIAVEITPVGNPTLVHHVFSYLFRRSSTSQKALLMPLLLYLHELPWAPLPPTYPRVMAVRSPRKVIDSWRIDINDDIQLAHQYMKRIAKRQTLFQPQQHKSTPSLPLPLPTALCAEKASVRDAQSQLEAKQKRLVPYSYAI